MKSINVIAKEYGLTTRTLRYYEELGILCSHRVDKGIRHYSKREEAKLKLILRGKSYGFSLEEIKEMVLLFDYDRSGKKQLEKTIEFGGQKLKEIDSKIAELIEIREEIVKTDRLFREKLQLLMEDET
ncbi:MerR family transcriptional regulator [Bacillus sp. BGMRC 2118]|nr:MerR family transcriptional regulator [Bacillus sp. BGMRC 2118]